jgi:phosphoglycerate dehydrogenase-like enzyme
VSAGSAEPGAPMQLVIGEDCTEFRLLRAAMGDDSVVDWLGGWLAAEADLDPGEYLQELRALGGGWTASAPEGREAVLEALTEADALLVEREPVDEELLAHASPRLRVIARFGTTTGNVDLKACERRGIDVRCISRPSTTSVAEHTLMLMLVLARQFAGEGRLKASDPEPRRSTPSSETGGHPPTRFNWKGLAAARLLEGRRLAVLGPGEAGRAVLERASGFGMELGYWGRAAAPEVERDLGARRLELDEVPRWADVVSVHLAYSPELKHVVDAEFLDSLGPDGLLINTARGMLVDFEALVAALRDGRLAAAGLDVFPEEPFTASPELLAMPNLALTPHFGGGGRRLLIEDVRAVFEALDRG